MDSHYPLQEQHGGKSTTTVERCAVLVRHAPGKRKSALASTDWLATLDGKEFSGRDLQAGTFELADARLKAGATSSTQTSSHRADLHTIL